MYTFSNVSKLLPNNFFFFEGVYSFKKQIFKKTGKIIKRSNFCYVTKKPGCGSGSRWLGILLAPLDPDPYIVKVLDPDPDPYIEYTDPQHCL